MIVLVNRCIINPWADEVGSSPESGPALAVGINNEFEITLNFILFCNKLLSVFW